MQRREFLARSSASIAGSLLGAMGLLTWAPRSEAAVIERTFHITEGLVEQIDGTQVYFRGYSRSADTLQVPGESLIVQAGDRLSITIVNGLSDSHSFVIDGVVNSGVIGPGQTKTVEFVAERPGTFLYYDNLQAPFNRLMGLHGGLAVMPKNSENELYPGSPTFRQQHFWIFNDIDPLWHERLRRGLTPATEYVPRYFTLNGLSGRPPGAPGNGDPTIDSMSDERSVLHGHVGDRTLIRIVNAGLASQSVHTHGNHMEWLTQNGIIRPDVWQKDCLYLDGNKGSLDVIYPFEPPPDAWPQVSKGAYPMHLHSEMSQTAGGGFYMFGAITEIFFESD